MPPAPPVAGEPPVADPLAPPVADPLAPPVAGVPAVPPVAEPLSPPVEVLPEAPPEPLPPLPVEASSESPQATAVSAAVDEIARIIARFFILLRSPKGSQRQRRVT
jgi:hypothetical protein